MIGDVLTIRDAAERLGVSRRRVQAFVEQRRLPAHRVGRQWLVSARHVRRLAHTLQPGPGRPLGPEEAWRRVTELADGAAVSAAGLDELRRRVHRRARCVGVYVHPGLFDRLRNRPDVVLGGLEAAAGAGAPVETGEFLDVYVRASRLDELIEDVAAEETAEGANVHLHAVDDAAWPFDPDQRVAGVWVAWLDLEDRLEREADLVLDRALGGRVVA